MGSRLNDSILVPDTTYNVAFPGNGPVPPDTSAQLRGDDRQAWTFMDVQKL